MDKGNLLFSTKLINADKSRETKKYLYTLYYLLIFLGFTLRASIEDWEDFTFPVSPGTVIFFLSMTGIGILLLHQYSSQMEDLGKINFFEKGFELDTGIKNRFISFAEISNIKIERGSTYHYEYKSDNKLVEINNWLFFDKDGIAEKHEFIIDSAEGNTNFEKMLIALRQKRVQHVFLSI